MESLRGGDMHTCLDEQGRVTEAGLEAASGSCSWPFSSEQRALALSSSLRDGNRKAKIADSGEQRAQPEREARYFLPHCRLHTPELAPGRSCMGPPVDMDVWSLGAVLQSW